MAQQLKTTRWIRTNAVWVFGLACSLGSLRAPSAQAQHPEKDAAAWKGLKYEEAKECRACHNTPRNADDKADLVLQTEYPIWKLQDKHAQAYAVLVGDRGKKIAKILEKDVLQAATGCLSCHAMQNLSKANTDNGGKKLPEEDGVSCSGCHGPSSTWGNVHPKAAEWRDKLSAADKYKVGMRDLRDPIVRAELCVSCHIGNVPEGKVVTHAMFAAGHPPLPPMEIASFTRNLPQHWRDPQFVPFFKDKGADPKVEADFHLESMAFQRSRFAVVGSAVALRETMKLARDQARGPDTGIERWPETALAHSDCYSCHHELRQPSYRQARGFGYGSKSIRTIPGRPLVRTWPLGLVAPNLGFANKANGMERFDQFLTDLARATNAKPFGVPADIDRATDEVVKWSEDLVKDLNDPKLFSRHDAAKNYIQALCALYAPGNPNGPVPDYETARLIASVLKALYEEVLLAEQAPEPKDVTDDKFRAVKDRTDRLFADLDRTLDLQPFKKRTERTHEVLKMIRVLAKLAPDDAEAKAAVLAFADFAANVNVGNPSKMRKNKLIDALNEVKDVDFTKGLTEGAVVKALQNLSDTEEQDVLNAIKGYDPAAFKAELEKVRKALK
jgi:hypothetical protein